MRASSPADFAGQRISSWGFGNEFEIFALGAAGLDPAADVEIVGQDSTCPACWRLISIPRSDDLQQYAGARSQEPRHRRLYTADDLNVVSYEAEGVGMLQDAIWADGDRLANDPEYKATAISFVKASLKGWAFCRDNTVICRDIVVENGPTLGSGHQLWQMNEINGLIWPSADGVG